MTRYSLKIENLTLSVVIPTLNTRKEFMYEALKSVEKQTFQPLEVIIINNGADKVKLPKLNLNIKEVQIIFKSGVAQARNFGVVIAKGDYIAFLDDDDFWADNYLEKTMIMVEKERPDCIVAKLDQFIDGKIKPFKNADGLLTKGIILNRNPGITGSSVVVRKTSFLNVGGYNPKLPPSEDKALILEMIQKNLKVMSNPESQAILRQHEKLDRLTDNKYMYEGIFQFYRLYKKQMSFNQRVYNLSKINKFKWLSEKSIFNLIIYLTLILYMLIVKILRI